jgi:hypothetical protein
MTINTTRYSPDTCDCVIDYTWDSESTEANRTHTLKQFANKCPAHSGLATDIDRWNAVFEENPRKNRALQLALDNGPTALYNLVSGNRQLKDNIRFDFSWSGTAPNRVLNISFTGLSLTTTQKNTIRGVLNNIFGTGKVVLL